MNHPGVIEGYKALTGAILERAIYDARGGDYSAFEWLKSEAAEFYFDSLGIHPDTVKYLIRKTEKQFHRLQVEGANNE